MYINKIVGEPEDELILRSGLIKEQNNLTWNQIAPELNQITGYSYSESYWRKKFKLLKQIKKEVATAIDNPSEARDGLNIQEQMRELERQRILFRDERNAWQKQNYNNARLSETFEILIEKLSKISNDKFSLENTLNKVNYSGNSSLIVCLSDWHIGAEFSSRFGKYDTDIAKIRLDYLLQKLVEIQTRHNCHTIHLICLGDMINGNIHKSLAITNRENVIDQIKVATELLSDFCYRCCSLFSEVNLYSVVGNHTRIDRKDDALHDERLDTIISWATSLLMQNMPNFKYHENNYDNGIAEIEIGAKKYIGVHGDFDPMTKNGVGNLSTLLGFIPYAILRGHNHHPAFTEANGVKLVQSGSLSGSGDGYTIEKRLSGKPSQTAIVCDENGIECIYNIEL